MTSLASVKLFQAENYLDDAETRVEDEAPYSPPVAVGHATDAIILAVDALCHSCNVATPKRHDQAQRVYLDLLRDHLIPEEAAQWREFLATAHRQRSAIQYHGEAVGKSEARSFIRKARGFVGFVRRCVQTADA